MIVVATPILNDDLSLVQRVEDFCVQKLITQAGVEAFDIAILLHRAKFDVGRLRPTVAIQALTASAMNSGPLSGRISDGTPRSRN